MADALANAVALTGDTDGANSGTVNWSFALDNNLVQYLAADETVTATYTITITDDSGVPSNSSNTQDVTVTITGTNDAPIIDLSTADSNTNNYEFTYVEGDVDIPILSETA